MLLGYRVGDMYVEALSLLTAFCYGVSAILNRMGMRDSNPMTGAMVNAVVQVAILSGLVIAAPPARMDWVGVAFFVASGLLASALGRLLNYTSIQKLGVSLSSTIIGSSPLFSLLLSYIFLRDSEKLGMRVVVGCLAIVAGATIITVL